MIEIVPITAEDAKALSELDRLCFGTPWSEKSFSDEAKNEIAVYYLAKDAGKTVGYCGYWQVADEGDITNIAVHPDYRRQGIAKKLLETVIKCAKKQALVLMTLEVRKSNQAAISLYEKYGFRQIGMRKNYYTNPREDALIMTMDMGEVYGLFDFGN
ncbi:MAG: ribosomal-protein-alanine N-acetyltransferase [Ruminococcaceae bacterium]|nr:ribosomal-protein-alanine N-acetyltransferase [Oscillospiraceae bacterium]